MNRKVINIITLRELLNTRRLLELNIIAGHGGLDRRISKVTVLDAPDGPRWLKGNELVLTSSYIFNNDESEIYKFVKDLIDSGAVGLGIKTGRYMENFPEKAIKLSNKFDFVIIEVPYKFVWSDIIGIFYELWYRVDSSENVKEYELAKLYEIYESSRWGSQQLMKKLSDLYNIPMAIINKERKVLTYNNTLRVEDMIKKIEVTKFSLSNTHDEILNIKDYNMIVKLTPSSSVGQEEYLVAISKNKRDMVEILDIFKKLNKLKLDSPIQKHDKNQIYNDFIQSLILGKTNPYNIKEFEKNRNYSGKIYNGIMLITGGEYSEVYKKTTKIIKENKKHNKDILIYASPNEEIEELVVMFEWINFERLIDVNIYLRDLLLKLNNNWLVKTNTYIYVGNIYEKFDKIKDSYKESLETKKMSKILWENQHVNFYSNIYIFTLYNKPDNSKLDMSEIYFLDDEKNQLQFNVVETLETYIESGNYKDAANRLFIHENTLRYRIKKISELLNINLDSGFNLYNLITKIKLWKLNN